MTIYAAAEGESRTIRWAELRALIGNPSWATVCRWEAAGQFPRRFKLSPLSGENGPAGWDYEEVQVWRAAQLKRRDEGAAHAR